MLRPRPQRGQLQLSAKRGAGSAVFGLAGSMRSEASGIQLLIGLHNLAEVFVLVHGPEAVGEDLDFARAGEAGLIHPGGDFGDGDAAFAHEAAVVENVSGGCTPVADVEGEQPLLDGGQIDLGAQGGVPPHMIDIHRDAEAGGRVEGITDFMRLAHGVHRAAVIGIHRVQRFDGEFDTGGFGIRQHGGNAFGDLMAGLGE